jgi:hypothetical protein
MATLHAVSPRRDTDRIFFTAMGSFVALLVFAGFARTYFLAQWWPQPTRVPEFTPLLQVHAALFTAWILLQAVQPALIGRGRRALHMRIGLLGAGLAFGVWVFGNMAAIAAMKIGYREVGDPYAFYAVTFFSMQAFGIIVLLAILKRRDGDAHKRLMLLSNAAILEAAVGRLPLDLVVRTAPASFYVGADLVIVAGVLYDLAARGRVHLVWIWGGGGLIVSQLFRLAIMDTAPWLGFAHAMARIA